TLLSFYFIDTISYQLYTLSLHDALPISWANRNRKAENEIRKTLSRFRHWMAVCYRGEFCRRYICSAWKVSSGDSVPAADQMNRRSEEHTSELQSHLNLVCRLLLEKKKKK